MKDRIPLNPGRVKLTPVTGETDLFDMEMADNPTELGTALNKANLLTDATAAAIAAAFGSTPDTPNEALALLANARIEIQSYVGTGTTTPTPTVISFSHLPKFVVVLAAQLSETYDKSASSYIPRGTMWAWSDIIAASAATRYKYAPTYFYSTGGYQRNARFTLSNDNKTISLLADANYGGGYDAENQLNANGYTYTVISFY